MSKTIKEERLRWVLPIVKKEVRLTDAAKVCPYSKRSLERWIKAYKEGGDAALAPKSTRPRTSPRETPIRIKERIIELRKEKRRCAFKLAIALGKEGIALNARTIGKILKQEKLTRRYRVKRVKYKYLKAKLEPGESLEIDVKYVPGRIIGERYFQYTAIDCASRWRHLAVFEEQSNYHSIMFLKDVMKKFSYRIRAVKTDNGFVFTNWYTGTYKRADFSPRQSHAFSRFCAQEGITHYLIDPGKPAQNGKVERSHRSDQESFYDTQVFSSVADLKRKLHLWNTEHNNLAHCGLGGQSPNEFLADYKLINPPNVCT